MAQKNFEHISHIKSRLPKEVESGEFYGLTPTVDNSDEQGSSPIKLNIAKRPTADKLVEGEIAVNYLKGHETLTIKNTEDEIVGFVNENEFNEAQEIIANAISKERDDRISSLSSLDGKVTKVEKETETFGKDIEELEFAISSSLNDLNDRLDNVDSQIDANINSINNKFTNLEDNIEEVEFAVSSSLNDLNDRIGEMDTQFNNINSRFENVNDKFSEIETVIEDNELVTASALNALNDKFEYVDSQFEDVDSEFENVNDKFSEIETVIEDNELVIASALNALNDKFEDVDSQFENVNDKFSEIEGIIEDNELVTSSALNDLNARINNLDGMNDEVNTLKATIKVLSNILLKGHDYVDLGLPSGTLWATMNVGATSETDYGLYFAWGETTGYTASQVGTAKQFDWIDYAFGSASPFTKYDQDGLTNLELTDDAAAANWGGEWHMPTKEQCEELFNTTYVTNTWVNDYLGSGVNGRLFTSVSNGNTLFVPAAGDCGDGRVGGVGDGGSVWASALDSGGVEDAWGFYFGSGSAGVFDNGRCYGQSVRGVVG